MPKVKVFLILSFCMNFFSCDEELVPSTYDTNSSREKLLINEWIYDYILMDNDTVRALSRDGEPQVTGIFEALENYSRQYTEDNSYKFKANEGFNQAYYGTGDNFQPNFGYWYLSNDGNFLIHNQAQTYEKRFEILVLTEQSLRLKLVGDRTSFLTDGNGIVIDTVSGSWTEVFVLKSGNN